jgi:hypothetical protein
VAAAPTLLRLEAIVTLDRHAAVAAARDAIGGAGGWIVGHSLYSDLMAVLNFALPAHRTGDLGRLLQARGIDPDDAPPETMGTCEQEVLGVLRMTFPHGTGDIARTVPDVG